MSIEIRTYDGTSEELSRYIVQTWRQSYEGKVIVPNWSPEYFDWQMTGPDFPDRRFLLSAWEGSRLVGTILAMPFPIWIHGEEVPGCHGSWLSVTEEYRRQGVASLLNKTLKQRLYEQNRHWLLGYAFRRSRASLGPKFWKKSGNDAQDARSVHLWARVINPRAVCGWTNKGSEKFLLKMLPAAVCNISRPHPDVVIRRYQPEDLEACYQLLDRKLRQADVATLWPRERLGLHLCYQQLSHTLVIERSGTVVGFVNYHLLGLILQQEVSSAVIDLLICEGLTSREITSLLNTMLRQMQQQGVDLVLMREFCSQPTISLMKSRFVPQLPESLLLLTRTHEVISTKSIKTRKIHVFWR